MNAAALIQLAISAVAVALMVGLAAWMTHGRAAPPLDEAEARRWLADEFPDLPIDGLWLATDEKGAVARSGDQALILSRMGDGYAARRLSWAKAIAAGLKNGRVRLALSDPGAPRAILAMAAWPPQAATAERAA